MKPEYEMSDTLFREAHRLVPGGVQTSRHPNMFVPGEYPIFMKSAKGSHVVDVDDNEYIDWLLSYGAIILGYCYEAVDEAVIREIRKGHLVNLTQPLQNQLAEKLISIIPCAEQAMFLSTGSDATAAAIRIARAYTGRDKILRYGYHGWHDWAYGGAGVPKGATQDVYPFKYNDIESVKDLYQRHKGQIACVIMMPYDVDLPQEGFLNKVRDITHENGSVLIFDEIRSGFHTALGGAQEFFGVTPDLTTLCKAISNGYPISAVVGKQKIMEMMQKTMISGTHFPSTIGMAAALATINELERTNAIEHCWHIGKLLTSGLKEVAKQSPVKANVIGITTMPFLLFGEREDYGRVWYSDSTSSPADPKAWKFAQRFYSEMARKGVFFHPNHHWFTCLAHTEEDVKKTIDKAFEVVDQLKTS